jgi:uncharacterized membrane protein
MKKIKDLMYNPAVEFIIFCGIFIGIGLLARVFSWMYWPSLTFYGIIFLGVIVGTVAGIVSAIKAGIANYKAGKSAASTTPPANPPA